MNRPQREAPPQPARPKRMPVPPRVQISHDDIGRVQGLVYNFMDHYPIPRHMVTLNIEYRVFTPAHSYLVCVRASFTGQFKTTLTFRVQIFQDGGSCLLSAIGALRYALDITVDEALPDIEIMESVLLRCMLENNFTKDGDDTE